MEKIFLEVYKDLHNSGYKEENPLKRFLFSTKQHAILIFYISSLNDKKSTLEDICYNISPKVISRSTVQNILKEGVKINFLIKEINKKDKRAKYFKLTESAEKLMLNWINNRKELFSNLK
tara:strand:+ start:132 stop:491 length:360 start_codon:yes stop_codon:yes gene_type:complete